MNAHSNSSVHEQLLYEGNYDDENENDNEEREGHWLKPITNLDIFFTNMYAYYVAKGLPHIILAQLCNTITLGFTIAFSVFLIVFVKWNSFFHNDCHDETSCGDIYDYIIISPVHYHSFLYLFLMIIYTILFAAFWLWKSQSAFHNISNAIEMERFFREILGFSLTDLQTAKWHDVTHRLISLHEQGTYRVALTKDKLTEHDIVLRIMRKENYLIALINKNCLDIHVPWWATPFMSERLFLTKSLEWFLSFCILEFMFDNEQFTISSKFLRDIEALEQRFFRFGLINLVLLPFMLIFMVIHFFLQNTQQFHSSKAYLGPRQWSPLALWKFREFNELPHIFDERMNKAYAPANDYLRLFHNAYVIALARFVTYISGSFIAVLLLISVLSEGVVLYVVIAEHNLLWYLGIFSAIYAGARSVIPDETIKVSGPTPEMLLENVSSCTHYSPLHWIGKYAHAEVKEEFEELFPYKVQVFAMEVFSVLLTPLVLCFSLPHSAHIVVNFVREHTKNVDGIGAVCDYSLFDFEKYGDEKYGAPISGRVHESQRPSGGKLEQSYLNFRLANPEWEGDRVGKAMEDRLNYFKAAKDQDREHQINSLMQQSQSSSYFNSSTLIPPLRRVISHPITHNKQTGRTTTDTRTTEEASDANDFANYFSSPCPPELRGLELDASHPSRPTTTADQKKQQTSLTTDEPITEETTSHRHAHKPQQHVQTRQHAHHRVTTTGGGGPIAGDNISSSNVNSPTADDPRIMSLLHPEFITTNRHPSNHYRHMQRPQTNINNTSTSLRSPPRPHPIAARSSKSSSLNTRSNGTDPSQPIDNRFTQQDQEINQGHNNIELVNQRSQINPTPPNYNLSNSNSYLNSSRFNAPRRNNAMYHRPANESSYFSSQLQSSSQAATAAAMPSVLRSILRQENIDYENDFYWLNKFQKERVKNPEELEKSLLLQSKMSMSNNEYNYSNSSMMASDALTMDSDLFNTLSDFDSPDSPLDDHNVPIIQAPGNSIGIKVQENNDIESV